MQSGQQLQHYKIQLNRSFGHILQKRRKQLPCLCKRKRAYKHKSKPDMAGLDFKAQDKMNKKKSQITMIMIIGLVLFIIVSLTFYLTKYSIKKQSSQNIKTINEATAGMQPIK